MAACRRVDSGVLLTNSGLALALFPQFAHRDWSTGNLVTE